MLTMFDSIYPSNIPAGSAAVAGYVGGHWPTYEGLVKAFPHAHVLSIAVASYQDAECLDVERGDATNAVAPGWVRRQQARGVRFPVLYTSVSNAKALLDTLAHEGIARRDIRLWAAHYTFKPHLCSAACGFGQILADATQWTDHAFGRSLDQSSVVDSFFFTPPLNPTTEKAPAGEPKNDSPFTRKLWPVPVPQWFWAWAEWRLGGRMTLRPADAPTVIPAWAWVRLAAL